MQRKLLTRYDIYVANVKKKIISHRKGTRFERDVLVQLSDNLSIQCTGRTAFVSAFVIRRDAVSGQAVGYMECINLFSRRGLTMLTFTLHTTRVANQCLPYEWSMI